MLVKLLDIINEIKEGKGENLLTSLDKDMKLRDDLELDSFDLALLTAKIEDEFDVDVFEDGLIETVGEILIKLEK
ncbi:phosphopantetheine-binding protein [uncultured Phascolarctobacterium sp.]|uniref:phosphopantetheine-binding protein n=1 Tax=uncultured Phascolarctobacterium sp. TaxID=512296 RepID=UPI0034260D2E